jgi:hypothetical protein
MLTFAAAFIMATAQAPAAVPATPATTENPGSKIKCRKLPVTGSLARFTRECRTLEEWAKLDNANRDSATRMQDRGLVVGCGSSPTGC